MKLNVAGLEPREIPSSDSAVVNRRTDQNCRSAGVAEIGDLFHSGDPATGGQPYRRIALANLLDQAACAYAQARSHASEIQNQQVPHAAVDRGFGQLARVVSPPGRRCCRFWTSLEQVETEDDSVCSGLIHDFRQLAWASDGLEAGNDRIQRTIKHEQRSHRPDIAYAAINPQMKSCVYESLIYLEPWEVAFNCVQVGQVECMQSQRAA
jgi:hypothetical protein